MAHQEDITFIIAPLPEDETPPLSEEYAVVEFPVVISSETVLFVVEVSSITVLVVAEPSLELLAVLSVVVSVAVVTSPELVLLIVADPSSLKVPSLETGVIVFSYNKLPSILINLIVSSPSSDTEA
jgi:hypothetical protein